MFEEPTKTAVNALFDQGLLGVLLFLSWSLFAFVAKYLIGQVKEAREETKAERADHKATIAKQMEDIRNLAKVPSSVDNLMPLVEMLIRNQKGG